MESRIPSRSINELVERQVKLWMNDQQARRAQGSSAPEPPRPVVTISREAGSRGTTLGRLVAGKLGFRLWDQELVQNIAEQSGASEALFAAVDERARSAIQDLLTGILIGDMGTETTYLASLLRVIHTIAQHGSAVIVGRGAQFVLEPSSVLRVRVVASIESRTRELETTRKLSEREARGEVERIDRERSAFNRHHFRRNTADPAAYDLVVNADAMPLANLADVVVAAYEAKFGRS